MDTTELPVFDTPADIPMATFVEPTLRYAAPNPIAVSSSPLAWNPAAVPIRVEFDPDRETPAFLPMDTTFADTTPKPALVPIEMHDVRNPAPIPIAIAFEALFELLVEDPIMTFDVPVTPNPALVPINTLALAAARPDLLPTATIFVSVAPTSDSSPIPNRDPNAFAFTPDDIPTNVELLAILFLPAFRPTNAFVLPIDD
jgi:hypothetical protein